MFGFKGKLKELEDSLLQTEKDRTNLQVQIKESQKILAIEEKELTEATYRLKQDEAHLAVCREKAANHAKTITACKDDYLVEVTRLSHAHFVSELTQQQVFTSGKLGDLPPFFSADWSDSRWQAWEHGVTSLSSRIAIGRWVEKQRHPKVPQLCVPAFAPFVGQHKTLFIDEARHPDISLGLFQHLVLTTALMLPAQCRHTLIDPPGQGRAFPMSRSMPDVRQISTDFIKELEDILADSSRIIQTYIDDETPSLDRLNPTLRSNEKFEFIFAANFPEGYDARTIEALQQVSRNGPIAGKYLFIHFNGKPMPRETALSGFESLYDIFESIPVDSPRDYEFNVALAPGSEQQKPVLDGLRLALPPLSNIDFATVCPDRSDWWTHSVTERIEANVGTTGVSDHLGLWFGTSSDGRHCSHGMLAAMPGSGKSNLYHVLICSLAARYSPRDLSFYLIDGKDGVEFQPYKSLPHARVVSLHSTPEMSRSILNELLAEKERRNQVFAQHKVEGLTDYLIKGSPAGRLPRIVLFVDEYQELFEDDKDGIGSNQILQLAQQGRNVGIHMFLGSQRFDVQGMMHQTAVFGNLHLRVAMKMALSDVQALTEFGRVGKQLIGTCDLPGKVVVNDEGGDDAANQLGKIAFLSGDERRAHVNALNDMAATALELNSSDRTIVFNGSEQPDFAFNVQVQRILGCPEEPTGEQWEKFARSAEHEAGLGDQQWFSGERPCVIWLGQEFNVHGQAKATFRLNPMENLMLVAESNIARYGLLEAAMASIAINQVKAEITVLDFSLPNTPWSGVLTDATDTFGVVNKIRLIKDEINAVAALQALAEEVEKRREAPHRDHKRHFVLIGDIDRCVSLHSKRVSAFEKDLSPGGNALTKIALEGSALGIHLVLAVAVYKPLLQIIEEHLVEQFRYRVVMQMGDDDGYTLTKSQMATTLQSHGAKPLVAALYDNLTSRLTRFKPYSIGEQSDLGDRAEESEDAVMPFEEQLSQVAAKLKQWRADDAKHG